MNNIPTITYSQISFWLTCVLQTGLSPFLMGGVGKGKSESIMQYAKDKNLVPIPIYLDSMYEMDIIGYANPNQETGKFEYLPCDLFPLEDTPLPKGKKGFLIIMEEFGNCPKSMQVAAQRIILDKHVGSHKLHPKTNIVLLGNKVSSGANAIPISSAIRTRCGIAELDTTSQESFNLFVDYMKRDGFHPSVIDWVTSNPDVVKKEDLSLVKDGESPFTTNRGIKAVSNLLNAMQKHADSTGTPFVSSAKGKEIVLQSILGYTNGSELYGQIMTPSVNYSDILTDPLNAQIPTKAAEVTKVASYLASSVNTDSLVKSMSVYLDRLNPEMRMSIASKLSSSSTYLETHPEVKKLFEFPF